MRRGVDIYRNVQNNTDSVVSLSKRAIRSILLYCQDWDNNKELSIEQRKQSLHAGIQLIGFVLESLNDMIPEEEKELYIAILLNGQRQMVDCLSDEKKRLIDFERALIKILEVMGQ